MSGVEIDLGVVHHFAGGCYCKEMHLPAGHYAVSHAHVYTHLSVLAAGMAEVQTGARIRRFKAPAVIQIEQGVEHRITALSDVTWLCIHRTDVTDPEGIDEVLIAKGE